MNLEQVLRNEIKAASLELFGQAVENIQLQPTNPEFEGSYTLVCFPLAKISKKGPEQTAQLIGDYLKTSTKVVDRFNVVKGFLNLVIADSFWIEAFKSIYENKKFGVAESNGKEIMVEYSSPNTNKPLHLGHLRNNFLGWSVAEIYKATGYKVHKVQIINDRGIHICKSMVAWKLYGNGETPESSGLKGDKLVGKYYVEFETASKVQIIKIFSSITPGEIFAPNTPIFNDYRDLFSTVFLNIFHEKHDAPLIEESISQLIAIHEKNKNQLTAEQSERILRTAEELAELIDLRTLLILQAQDMLQKWEQGDLDTINLWTMMNNWVYAGFDATYKRMGVDFERLYFESKTYLLGKEEVMKGLAQGVFFKKDDGSVWVDLTPDGLDQKLLLRSDGTSVYMTQDFGTAIMRFREFPKIEKQVYTVGNEQEYHFKVLFLILAKLGYAWAKECYHLSYGMVDLPSGKMKSREGTVVDADDLMAEMVEEAARQTKELGKVDEMEAAEIAELSETIGLGALKFFLLKVDPRKRMLFDPAESIQLQGHTGPFIQYTYARISSILRKAQAQNLEAAVVAGMTTLEPAERDSLFMITQYPAKVQEAAREYSPAVIANYAFELAKQYNHFYQSIPVFAETDQAKLKFRIAFSEVTSEVLKKAMGLLGIRVPERM